MWKLREAHKCACAYMRPLSVAVVPVLLAPLIFLLPGQLGKCCYMVALMAVFWLTEVIPLAATGLIPVFLAPLFGLLTSAQLAGNYMKDVTLMMVGGLIVAVAIEKSHLHMRIAFLILSLIGTSVHWLMLGFMLPTFLCSMFISNTATTAMMLPIMEAVLVQLRDTTGGLEDPDEQMFGVRNHGLEADDIIIENKPKGNGSVSLTDMRTSDHPQEPRGSSVSITVEQAEDAHADRQGESPYFKRIAKGMTLAVCYAANVGGTATLTGTSPNLIAKGHADQIWEAHGQSESPVFYSSWIIWGLPSALLNFGLIYAWLLLYCVGGRAFVCRHRKKDDGGRSAAVKAVIDEQYRALGSIKFAEVAVSALFVLLVLMWFFRNPGFIYGWSTFFKEGYVSDAVPAMLIANVLFCVPMANPWRHQRAPALLAWQDVNDKFPWSILFLMGGGFSLAQATTVSGLSEFIGDKLTVFEHLPKCLMIAIICFLVAMLTEVTSNVATCTILMPIMASMAEKLGCNPLFLMLPTATSASYAFMLPVATVPNAIAFSYGRLTVLDMIKGGAVLNILCVFSVTLGTVTWGTALFNFNDIPWDDTALSNTLAPLNITVADVVDMVTIA